MTSLEEAIVGIAADARPWQIKKVAEGYINELEKYMRSEHHYGDVEVAISNMLRFLRGE